MPFVSKIIERQVHVYMFKQFTEIWHQIQASGEDILFNKKHINLIKALTVAHMVLYALICICITYEMLIFHLQASHIIVFIHC